MITKPCSAAYRALLSLVALLATLEAPLLVPQQLLGETALRVLLGLGHELALLGGRVISLLLLLTLVGPVLTATVEARGRWLALADSAGELTLSTRLVSLGSIRVPPLASAAAARFAALRSSTRWRLG